MPACAAVERFNIGKPRFGGRGSDHAASRLCGERGAAAAPGGSPSAALPPAWCARRAALPARTYEPVCTVMRDGMFALMRARACKGARMGVQRRAQVLLAPMEEGRYPKDDCPDARACTQGSMCTPRVFRGVRRRRLAPDRRVGASSARFGQKVTSGVYAQPLLRPKELQALVCGEALRMFAGRAAALEEGSSTDEAWRTSSGGRPPRAPTRNANRCLLMRAHRSARQSAPGGRGRRWRPRMHGGSALLVSVHAPGPRHMPIAGARAGWELKDETSTFSSCQYV